MASVGAWPPVGWEDIPWQPSIPPELVSRRVRERHTGPYRAAVVPAIAKLAVSLPVDVLALADEASIEIARFDATMGDEATAFASVLLRSESASSSQIENLTSSAKAIALADIGEPSRNNATQIVANVRAMQAAMALADRLDAESILAMQRSLMAEHDPVAARNWRTQQVWIGGGDFGPHHATFVPPHHRHVPGLIDDLVAFMSRDDIPVLAHVALAHAQFETIHPFVDGNGRTGRALIHSMLRAKGLSRGTTVPLSAGLLADTDNYFDALTRYRDGDATAIVTVMSEAALSAVVRGRDLVGELRAIRARWDKTISARRDSVAWQLANMMLRRPVIDAHTVQRELGATSANAHRAIRQLTEAGVITEFTGRHRNRLWQASEVITALDDFATRAQRGR